MECSLKDLPSGAWLGPPAPSHWSLSRSAECMVRAPQPISLYFPFGLGDPWLHWLVSLPSKHSTSHLPLTSLDPSTSEDTSAPLISFLIGLERVLYPASLALALKKQLCRKTDQERLSSSPTFPPPRPAPTHSPNNWSDLIFSTVFSKIAKEAKSQ